MKKYIPSPRHRIEVWRQERHRLTLLGDSHVWLIHVLKIKQPEKPARCRWCGKEEANAQGLCIDCFQVWRGQKLPEPRVQA